MFHWVVGSPKRFKTYVSNRVSNIVELLEPEHWHYVSGMDNPADCASRVLFPSELIDHDLWWEGRSWLKLPPSHWPLQPQITELSLIPEEEKEVSLVMLTQPMESPVDRFSSCTHLKSVTAWIMRFTGNCCAKQQKTFAPHLSVMELQKAEVYWQALINITSRRRSLISRRDIDLTSQVHSSLSTHFSMLTTSSESVVMSRTQTEHTPLNTPLCYMALIP